MRDWYSAKWGIVRPYIKVWLGLPLFIILIFVLPFFLTGCKDNTVRVEPAPKQTVVLEKPQRIVDPPMPIGSKP